MKKIITWLLIVMMMISVTACTKEDESKNQAKQETATQKTLSTETKKEKSTEKKQAKSEKKGKETQKKKKSKKTGKNQEVTETKKSEKKSTTKNDTKTTEKKKEQSTTANTTSAKDEHYCQIVISCKTVLNHKEQLQSNYQIPSGGRIYSGKIKIEEGDTAMTVLRKTGVEIDTSKGYVQGIDGLYEFDCGRNSGWMYKVNGNFPNVGASQYKLDDGDEVQWLYTCEKGDL